MHFLNRFAGTSVALVALLLLVRPVTSRGQASLMLDLSAIDGVELRPDNIFNYKVTSNAETEVNIKGSVRFRNSEMGFSYSLRRKLRQGVNDFSWQDFNPVWQYSSSALRQLFTEHKKLPAGTYQYCVEISEVSLSGEKQSEVLARECLYQKVEDIFLITLIEPENKAKIKEYNPMLSWVANCPFVHELTYRLRLTDIKDGQTTESAILRNNAIYDEKNLVQTSIVYPVYAKPLQKLQPYAWTVDAYFKGILLGGAAPWSFIIIEDSVLVPVVMGQPFVEVNIEQGLSPLQAPGELRLKYIEGEYLQDTIKVVIKDAKDNVVQHPVQQWNVAKGENRLVLPFHDVITLKHLQEYQVELTTSHEAVYRVKFTYINPLYIKKESEK